MSFYWPYIQKYIRTHHNWVSIDSVLNMHQVERQKFSWSSSVFWYTLNSNFYKIKERYTRRNAARVKQHRLKEERKQFIYSTSYSARDRYTSELKLKDCRKIIVKINLLFQIAFTLQEACHWYNCWHMCNVWTCTLCTYNYSNTLPTGKHSAYNLMLGAYWITNLCNVYKTKLYIYCILNVNICLYLQLSAIPRKVYHFHSSSFCKTM